jgi:hypothetical protein
MYLSRPIWLCKDSRAAGFALRAVCFVTLPLLAVGLSLTGPRSHAVEYKGGANTAALFATSYQHADSELLTSQQLASRIDGVLGESWKSAGISPAPATTDSEFVRRIYLDLNGRIPSVAETLAFLNDREPTKRSRLVEELLSRGACAAHFANTWRDLLLAGSASPELRAQSAGLETWLRLRFAVNMPYDELVRQLLTAPARTTAGSMSEPSVMAFYQAADYKPEQLAASASRVFLGIQLQCAQCHDHPFAAWKRPQFWQFAALFTSMNAEGANADGAPAPAIDADGIRIPDTETTVAACFLDGSAPTAGQTKRAALAKWITGSTNGLFARAAVNRLWNHFFGRGLVDPVDHLDAGTAAGQPQVFDELTEQFVLHGYDLKYLIRVITATDAYQRSSRAADGGGAIAQADRQARLFARMPLRRMTSDQLYASFVEATGFQAGAASPANPFETTARDDFQIRFADASVPPTEAPTTILQALALMNGKYVAAATHLTESKNLAAIFEAPYLDTQGRAEMLFVAALTRRPDETESKQIADYLADNKKRDEKTVLADLFWSLLNSAEFVLNH